MRSVTGTGEPSPAVPAGRARRGPPERRQQRRELVGQQARRDAHRERRRPPPSPSASERGATRPRRAPATETTQRTGETANGERFTTSPTCSSDEKRQERDRVLRLQDQLEQRPGRRSRPPAARGTASRAGRPSRSPTSQGVSLRCPANADGPRRPERQEGRDQRLGLADGQRPEQRHREHAGASSDDPARPQPDEREDRRDDQDRLPDEGGGLERQQGERSEQDREERRVAVERGVVRGGGLLVERQARVERAPAS